MEINSNEKKEISYKEQRIKKITHLYYSREDIQKAIFKFSKNREISPRYFEGFGKRPDSFQYLGDIMELVKKGATSFHCSEEIWKDPLKIITGMNISQANELREGWDLIIDIDSKYIDYSKISAEIIINMLKFHGIKHLKVKFSGSKGFHIIIPWKAFPKEVNELKTSEMFPEYPRIIVQYILEKTKSQLIEKISELGRPNKYIKDYQAPKEVMPDLILVSPRHLFRMPYSVEFNEPICIKKGKKTKIVKIGGFIDQFFNSKKDLQIKEISNLNYETISLDIEKNKTRFSKITHVIRHKLNEEMFNVKLKSGREAKVTSGHSLFVLRNGKIEIIKGDNLNKEDYLIVLRKINLTKDINRINLADELIETVKKEKKNIFLYNFNDSIFNEVYKLNIPKRRFEQRYNWKVYNILPLDVYELLMQKKPSLKNYFNKSKIKYSKHGGRTRGLPNLLELDKDLMRLLGYYISEGHCDILRNRIAFSFGSHEKKLINDCKKILKSLNMNPKIRKPHNTAIQIVIHSPILKLILSSLFKCGRNANEKRIPSILWGVEEKLRIEFLNSYIRGDGHLEKKWAKIIIYTASKRLQEDLCFLLSSFGSGYSLSNRKLTKWNKSNKEYYIIIVQGKRDVEKLGFITKSSIIKESLINRFPIKELGLEKSILNSRWKNQYIHKKIIERNKNFIEKLNPSNEILNLINGDISFLKVKEIKKIIPNCKYVYDISVKNDENFVGGNCILLHNSLHEKTALSSIVLEPEEIKDFQLKDADPMKISSDKIKDFMPDSKEGEASELLLQALDWHKEQNLNKPETKNYTGYKPIQLSNLSDNNFPPCIQNILKGIDDGKKRALFILINLFRSIGMDKDELEKRIEEWNKKNKVPLRQGYIQAQLSWGFKKKPIMPPNCKEFYQGIGICIPDDFCKLIKNPVNYTVRKNLLSNKKVKKKDVREKAE